MAVMMEAVAAPVPPPRAKKLARLAREKRDQRTVTWVIILQRNVNRHFFSDPS